MNSHRVIGKLMLAPILSSVISIFLNTGWSTLIGYRGTSYSLILPDADWLTTGHVLISRSSDWLWGTLRYHGLSWLVGACYLDPDWCARNNHVTERSSNQNAGGDSGEPIRTRQPFEPELSRVFIIIPSSSRDLFSLVQILLSKV